MFELEPPKDDGLYIPTVGDWSRDKHHFLRRYIDAFTTAMRDKAWSGLHYIDLFAGAGIERLQSSGDLDWGSPLIAAQSSVPFHGIHLCELNEKRYAALRARVDRFRPDAQIVQGDANLVVAEIIREVPTKSLSLVFLDPYGLHLHFATLQILAGKRTDLIIFFPDHLDALRNCEWVYHDDPNSNLDRVLGVGSGWRTALESRPGDRWAQLLRERYEAQIRTLGYQFFDYERITMKNRPLYLLIFCSRSNVGLQIWRNIARKKPDDQNTFDFSSTD